MVEVPKNIYRMIFNNTLNFKAHLIIYLNGKPLNLIVKNYPKQ